MTSPLRSIIDSGTKLWLDSIDPQLISESIGYGATGATSNPIIVANILKSGKYDTDMKTLKSEGHDHSSIAWQLTDRLVSNAEKSFLPIFEQTNGNDGYVSFELDPLLEDPEQNLTDAQKVERYVELAIKWSKNHKNRLIKVPATPAGIKALTPLSEKEINVNVTLIFTLNQLQDARKAVWEGVKNRKNLKLFKSVYSIFVSRLDVYADQNLPNLSKEAKEVLGIYNAKKAWKDNTEFWKKIGLPLQQEIVFASTGTKKPTDKPWKYVEAFCGSDIETNPPETNSKVNLSGCKFTSQIQKEIAPDIVQELENKVDWNKLEATLMAEGLEKFSTPQKNLIELIATKVG